MARPLRIEKAGGWYHVTSCGNRYLHLNPVRIQALGMSKAHRPAQRLGLSPAPSAEEARRRREILRQYRWSSYRAYVGLVGVPRWLECETVLGLGGGSKAEQRRRYRDTWRARCARACRRVPGNLFGSKWCWVGRNS